MDRTGSSTGQLLTSRGPRRGQLRRADRERDPENVRKPLEGVEAHGVTATFDTGHRGVRRAEFVGELLLGPTPGAAAVDHDAGDRAVRRQLVVLLAVCRAPAISSSGCLEPAGFPLAYAKTPSPKPSISASTRRYSPDRTRSTGRS